MAEVDNHQEELAEMSHQRMNFDETNRSEHDEPSPSYSAGYEEAPHYNSYSFAAQGQKLSGQSGSRMTTAGQRLALAIVSLVFLMILIFVGLALGISGRYEPGGGTILFFFFVMFAMFFAAIIVINVMFNRRQ